MNKKTLENLKKALLPNKNIAFAYLFGSRANNKQTPMSDTDVAVYLRNNVHLEDEKLNLLDSLTAHLKTENIDLVILNTAPLSLAARILKTRVVVIDRLPLIRHQYESLVMRKSFDFHTLESAILNRRYGVG